MSDITMRDLILNKLKIILKGATPNTHRWANFGMMTYTLVLKKELTSKEGKRELKHLKLDEVDYSVLSDVELLEVYEFSVRKYFGQY